MMKSSGPKEGSLRMGGTAGHNGGMLPLALIVAFLLVPVLEIYVILQVGHLIGGWPTVALLVIESLLGAWIVRREGRRAWRALRETLLQGGLPERELADAVLVLLGGVLLLTPGFVTDFFGLWFVLPFTRPLVRRLGAAYLGRRIRAAQSTAFGEDSPGPEPVVVRGEVVEEDRERDQR